MTTKEKLQDIAERLNYSQSDMARHIGVDIITMHKWVHKNEPLSRPATALINMWYENLALKDKLEQWELVKRILMQKD